MTEARYIALSANILHCSKSDKGNGRKRLQFRVVDGVPHIQEFHLERKSDVVVIFGIVRKPRFAERIPAILSVIDDERHHGYVLSALQEQVVIILRNLKKHIVPVGRLVLGDDSHVEPGDAAVLEIRLENEVRGACMLVTGKVFARSSQACKVDGV